MAGITGADSSFLQVVAANSHRFAGVVTQKSDMDEDGLVLGNDTIRSRMYIANPRNAMWDNPSQALKSPENPDAGELSFTDSLGRTGSVTIALLRVRGDQFSTSKYSGTSSVNPSASRQEIFYLATSSSGETIISDVRVDSAGVVPAGYNLNLTFATSGATASVALDLSGLSFTSYDIAASSYRPGAIGFTNVLNQYSARRGLDIVNNRIDDLSALEGQYGAVESRLNVAHNILATSGENFAAAASRIKDADIANEAATSVRSGILQQAATSLLAQANQAPRIALSLLSGI